MRYFLEIAYLGTHYFGWQRQPTVLTVQEVVETSLSTLLRKETPVVGAGRTDTGVHAKQLFAHFDTDFELDEIDLKYRLNSLLPKDISIQSIRNVTSEAHARFHATKRSYEYMLITSKNPFMEGFAYWVHRTPNVTAMNKAAELLLTHRDFQCFSRSNTDVKTYYCDISTAKWEEENEKLVFKISADRFLRNMVRAIVGTLLEVGYGKCSLKELQTILDSKNRSNAGASAPAHGLYLTEVAYPETLFTK